MNIESIETIDTKRDTIVMKTPCQFGKSDDAYTPYWIQSKLMEKSNCNQYKRPSDNLLATAIFDIAVTTNPNVTTQTRAEYMEIELKRSIIQMDSEPFQRLVGALSELGLREILMEIMRIRHDSTIEPETRFRL